MIVLSPFDRHDEDGLRMLLRAIFQAAGGTHDDWETYDRTMRAEHRTAVVVTPTRLYTNPTETAR